MMERRNTAKLYRLALGFDLWGFLLPNQTSPKSDLVAGLLEHLVHDTQCRAILQCATSVTENLFNNLPNKSFALVLALTLALELFPLLRGGKVQGITQPHRWQRPDAALPLPFVERLAAI